MARLLPPTEVPALTIWPEEDAVLALWLAEEVMVMMPPEEMEAIEPVVVLTPIKQPPWLTLLQAKTPAELQWCLPSC